MQMRAHTDYYLLLIYYLFNVDPLFLKTVMKPLC